MTEQRLSEDAVRGFGEKLETFSKSLTDQERRFLGVILASASTAYQDVHGYSELDPTGLDIGETTAQVYYQYLDVRGSQDADQGEESQQTS